MLLDDCIEHHARYRPEKTAFIFRDQRWSYRYLDEQVNRCANVLLALGVRRGERVAILTPNSPWFMVVLFAAARLGAILVPGNYRLSGFELRDQLEHAAVHLLIAEATQLDRVLDAGFAAPPGGLMTIGETTRAGVRHLPDLVSQAASVRPSVQVTGKDPVLLQYTSGTTGKPKGVLSIHAAWVQSCLIQSPLKRVFEHSVVMNVLPMCHTGGTKWMLESLFPGATAVIAERFDVEEVMAEIERHRATNIGLVPTLFYQILDAQAARRRDLASLRYVNCGGAPLSEKRMLQAVELLNCDLTQGYGMTEMAGGSISFAGPEDHICNGVVSPKLASVGRPLIDCKVRIVDDNGADVPQGEPGELLVKSARTLAGYWGEPPESSPVDADGYYHTGDLLREDADGYLYVVDRKKDMIISGGLNIYSKEVEEAIIAHPAVAEAYVVGLPDEHWGETVHAIVALREGATCTAEDIREWCRARIASYKKPSGVTFMAAADLPRTAMGKVQKRVLRELLARSKQHAS